MNDLNSLYNNNGIVSNKSINEMSGFDFEKIILALLLKMGFDASITKASGDGGIDIIAYCNQDFFEGKYIIQCKRWNGSIGEPVLRDLYGVLTSERANKGILITNSNFTTAAINFASNKPLELIDGQKLINLLIKHNMTDLIDNCNINDDDDDDDLSYIRKVIRDDPNNIRLRVKYGYELLNEIINQYNITSNAELLMKINECEKNLNYLFSMNLSRNDKAQNFIKYLSYFQFGMLKIFRGEIAEGIKYLYKIREINTFSKHPIFNYMYDGADTLNEIYVLSTLNIIHLLYYLKEDELAKKIANFNNKKFQIYIDEQKNLIESQGYEKSTVEIEFKNLNNYFENKNLLIMACFFSNDINDFLDEDQDDSSYDFYSYGEEFFNIDKDLEKGIFSDVCNLTNENLLKQKKILKAFI